MHNAQLNEYPSDDDPMDVRIPRRSVFRQAVAALTGLTVGSAIAGETVAVVKDDYLEQQRAVWQHNLALTFAAEAKARADTSQIYLGVGSIMQLLAGKQVILPDRVAETMATLSNAATTNLSDRTIEEQIVANFQLAMEVLDNAYPSNAAAGVGATDMQRWNTLLALGAIGQIGPIRFPSGGPVGVLANAQSFMNTLANMSADFTRHDSTVMPVFYISDDNVQLARNMTDRFARTIDTDSYDPAIRQRILSAPITNADGSHPLLGVAYEVVTTALYRLSNASSAG